MKVTPDIIRCELIGAEAQVAKSTHADYVGLSGKIIDETRNTLTLLREGTKRMIMKDSTIFHFKFYDGTIVEVDGRLIVGRPEDRLKKRVRRLW